MATFGSTSAPSNNVEYFDALFTLSLANYQKEMIDNISSSNPFLKKIKESDMYRAKEGGKFLTIPLMYALGEADSYDGYDELSTVPMDGITEAVYEWRQLAIPIVYSMKEVIQNRNGIKDLVRAKLLQAEMGFQESWIKHFLQGNGTGYLSTAHTSVTNGSLSINPIAHLIQDDPTASVVVGNINQSTSSWWQNQNKDSTATTLTGLLNEFDAMYNKLALGVGGAPNLIIVDPTTSELIVQALYLKYQQVGSDNLFPFENTKFKKAIIVSDDKVPDYYNNTANYTTNGTAIFLNTKFFEVDYIKDRNFSMLTDENGKTFQKPINGDSRVGHMAWMGQVLCSNRKKQGVLAKIARTLTAS